MGEQGGWGADEMAAALPSWRPGATRDWLCETLASAADVPPADRVAAFDNDGTLACEKPESATKAYLLHLDPDARPRDGHEVQRLLAGALAGLTTDDAALRAAAFLAQARHPRFGLPYPQLVYRPMRELVALLGRLGFSVYIVSDSSRDFLRVMSPTAYGVPVEHVIGSEAVLTWKDGRLVREARLMPLDDGPGKPGYVWERAYRLPWLAVGNAEGDTELLESARHAMLVRHDDAAREYAYEDEDVLDAARSRGWTVVSMRDDFADVFGGAG
ncbi:MAG TPA: haloacid dehalogenase-like hydrolase [Propionibacteriaceae bacterium]|nr:haloacid dehalogenase-like hydrolase [Propionibacteriaceae bacterium]